MGTEQLCTHPLPQVNDIHSFIRLFAEGIRPTCAAIQSYEQSNMSTTAGHRAPLILALKLT